MKIVGLLVCVFRLADSRDEREGAWRIRAAIGRDRRDSSSRRSVHSRSSIALISKTRSGKPEREY